MTRFWPATAMTRFTEATATTPSPPARAQITSIWATETILSLPARQRPSPDLQTTTRSFSATGANTVFGGYGNDSITAGSGNDSIMGLTGNDTIPRRRRQRLRRWRPGAATRSFWGNGTDTVYGGPAATVTGVSDNDIDHRRDRSADAPSMAATETTPSVLPAALARSSSLARTATDTITAADGNDLDRRRHRQRLDYRRQRQ